MQLVSQLVTLEYLLNILDPLIYIIVTSQKKMIVNKTFLTLSFYIFSHVKLCIFKGYELS